MHRRLSLAIAIALLAAFLVQPCFAEQKIVKFGVNGMT